MKNLMIHYFYGLIFKTFELKRQLLFWILFVSVAHHDQGCPETWGLWAALEQMRNQLQKLSSPLWFILMIFKL